jgi:DNA (cytosine-5)-methyltransferase 1
MKRSKTPICVDLFCGSGGLSDGLKMAGFKTAFAVDMDKIAATTFARNHKETEVAVNDIAAIQPKDILSATEGQEVDLLAGGPSCQGYSTHGKRQADDPRNFLFEHFIRLAKGVQPKWILIENVQGLLTYQKGYFKTLIMNKLRDLGYDVDVRVMCAADYGVPQLRRRILFIATRTGNPISFPPPTHADFLQPNLLPFHNLKPYVTVGEALADLPSLKDADRSGYTQAPKTEFQRYARDGSSTLTLHEASALSEQAMEIAKLVGEGEGLRAVPVHLLPERFQKMRRISTGALRRDCTTLYYRLSRNKPSYTITCYFRNVASGPFLHPSENRSLSYREAARLMSFRDTYEFESRYLARQIGNAVPPLLGKAIGEHLLSVMSESVRVLRAAA